MSFFNEDAAKRSQIQVITFDGTDNQTRRPPDQQACIDRAAAQAGGAPLEPSFFIDTLYQGKPARVLVATVASAPGQARYFVFPAGDCSVPPVAQGQGSATPR